MITVGHSRSGFTIVELLIVIVVIAILAAITVVAYNGIQNRAKETSVQSATSQIGKKVLSYATQNSDLFPTQATYVTDLSLPASTPSTTYDYFVADNRKSFCISATNTTASPETAFAFTQSGQVVPGRCVRNLSQNPHAVSSTASWTNQTPTGSTVNYAAGTAQDGGSSYQVATTQSGQLRIAMPQSVGVLSGGDTVTVGVDLFSPVATQAQVEMALGGVFLRSDLMNISSGWNRLKGTITIPQDTSGAVTLVQALSLTNSVSASQTWRASRATVTKGTTDYTYGDGNSTNWAWVGTPNNSHSFGPSSQVTQ